MSGPFDAIIVGAGQAGPPLAARLAEAGMASCIIERGLIGGTCVNTGCTPTKSLVSSATAVRVIRRAAELGIAVPSGVSVDFPAVMTRARSIAAQSRDGVETALRKLKACRIVRGQAKFVGPKTVEVNGERISAPKIFINVGGRAAVPHFPGIDDIAYLTNSSLLRLETLPEHLVVVGGSYIGLEFAQMFRRFGSAVTVVEKAERLISREDEPVSQAIRTILESEGVTIRTEAECIHFPASASGVAVGLECRSGDRTVVGSHVLLAVGRAPNTDDLGLEVAGIDMDERGFIVVNDRLETTVDGVWAMGDCNGRGAFTHTAYNDHEIIADNLLDRSDRKVTDRIECYALYTDPPLARAGLSVSAARRAGLSVETQRREMTQVGRAVEKGETAGFMEVVVDAITGRLLGAAILGTGGDEAIHSIIDMMANQATAAKLRTTVHIHPTVAELLPTIAGGAERTRRDGRQLGNPSLTG